MAPRAQPTLCQVALVTADVPRSVRFYGELLGLRYAGHIPVRGRVAARMFDVPRVQGECHWLAGDDPFFQVELFHFDEPSSRPASRRPDGVGYQRVGVEVPNVDAALRAVERLGGRPSAEVHRGADGDRAWASDPDGVLIELIAPPRAVARARLVGVAAVVDDLDDAVHYFSDGFGLEKSVPGAARGGPPPRDDERGPCPPPAERVVLAAGPYWLELNRYADRPPAPAASAPRLTDRGLMNIALGVRTPGEFRHLYRALLRQGRRGATEPVGSAFGHTIYMRPTGGLSVELLQLAPLFDSLWGFKSPGRAAAAVQGVLRFLLSHQPQPGPGSAGAT